MVSLLAFSERETLSDYPLFAFVHKPIVFYAQSFDEAIEEAKETLFKQFPPSEGWVSHSATLISLTERLLSLILELKERNGFVKFNETNEDFETRTVKFDADGLITDDSIKELSSIA